MRGQSPNCLGLFVLFPYRDIAIFLSLSLSHAVSFFLYRAYLLKNPSFLLMVFFYLFLPLIRPEQSLDTCNALITPSIIASIDDLSNMLANNFHLTSKEDDDIDAGETPLDKQFA